MIRLFALLVTFSSLFACVGPTKPLTPSAISTASTALPTYATTTPAPSHSRLDKWTLWSHGTQLRGANIYQRRVYPELDGPTFMGQGPVGPPYTQADFDRLASMGANYVNISGPGLFRETPPYTLDTAVQANLDRLLAMAAKADLFAVITFRTGPGRSEFWAFWGEDTVNDPQGGWFDPSYYDNKVWGDRAAQDAWVAMWRYAADRYMDNPVVVGYDLMCEPNSNEVGSYPAGQPLDIWDPADFYKTYGGTLYDWNQLFSRISTAIRQVDANTPILVGGMAYSAVDWLPYVRPAGDKRTVYTVHQYAPMAYTHQNASDLGNSYPGHFDTDGDGTADTFNRTWLDDWLATIDDFTRTHRVPVAANEFGAMRWEPGVAQFMDDEMALFEKRGLNYALWLWETSWPPYQAEVDDFNFRHGPDPNHHADLTDSALIDVIKKYWRRNSVRPSTFGRGKSFLPRVLATAGPSGLTAVNDFLYQLQNIDLAAIGNTAYDLVIIDYSADGSDDGAFSATQIRTLQHSPGGNKIVLAYLSIGEAEDYRFYWQKGWCPGNPAWLDAENPNWPGNYKVHYWDPAWQAIIFRYVDRLLDAGFDGAYLDIIDAYEYYQDRGRTDAPREMVDFVAAIRAYARRQDPNFLIFPQNGAGLAAVVPAYLRSVDGIGQEDVYYGYEADDTMTPPTVTAGLERSLALFRAAGKLVLTTDYATTPAHVDDAYAKSQHAGFVPFCTVRDLDRLTINAGHPPD